MDIASISSGDNDSYTKVYSVIENNPMEISDEQLKVTGDKDLEVVPAVAGDSQSTSVHQEN